jgi:hypothetical protein
VSITGSTSPRVNALSETKASLLGNIKASGFLFCFSTLSTTLPDTLKKKTEKKPASASAH